MRKIQPSLESEGYSSYDDLVKLSLPKLSGVITVGPANCDYTSPLDAANAAAANQSILVYPGQYYIGSSYITLPASVNWIFLGNVYIYNDSANCLFFAPDGNGNVFRFFGNPRFENLVDSPIFNISDGQIISSAPFFKYYIHRGDVFITSNNLPDLSTLAQPNDTIVIHSGTYDIGSEYLYLKDDVNWFFYPGVKITSSSASGTFTDLGSSRSLNFNQLPEIINTGNGGIFNLHNGSEIKGVSLFLKFFFESVGTNYIYFSVHTSNISSTMLQGTTSKVGTGHYRRTFNQPLIAGNLANVLRYGGFLAVDTSTGDVIKCTVDLSSATTIDFTFKNLAGTAVDFNGASLLMTYKFEINLFTNLPADFMYE